MKSRVFNISFCIYLLAAWMSYPTLAQVGSPQGPSVPSSPSAPQAPPPNPFQSETSLNQPFPTSQQSELSTQGADVSPPSKDLQDSTSRRYLQAKEATPKTEPLSSVETAFQEMVLSRTPAGAGITRGGLSQFGYSLFTGRVSTFAPVEDVPVGPDYILGPGDELQINIWGAMEKAYVTKVDRNGRIYLPTVGPVRVWGLTFSQAEKLIIANLSQYYKGFQTSVTMGRLRTIKVYVVGEVNQPGSFTISSLSTLTNALFAAGGPSKTGSLRKVELKRSHHTEAVFDFYDFLLHGDKRHDYRLQSGDVIFVPTIGPVVGIVGEIKRPAIYELKETMRVSSLIDTAGGTTPQSYLKRVQIIRSKPNAEQEVIDLDLTKIDKNEDMALQSGDLVRIYPADPRIYNTISLNGSVKHPGEYEIKPGMRLSQLLPTDTLLPEAYLDNIEIVRLKNDLTTEVIHVNIKSVWSGQFPDIILQPRDLISVRTEFKAAESVILAGEVKLPGIYTIGRGERLGSVIKRARGFTNRAYLKGVVFTRRTVAMREREQLDKFLQQFEESSLTEKKSTMFGISPEQAKLREIEEARKKDLLRVIASKVMLGRIVIHLDDMEKFEGSPDDIMLEGGDTLTIPQQPAEVMIMGSVRNPTAVLHKKGENTEYYINRGGGFSKGADKKEMYLLKADGSAIVGFLKLRDVDPGDAIIVPPKVRIKDLTWLTQIATMVGNTALTMGGLAAITK